MATVRFMDGPCKGTSRQITEAGGRGGTTLCGGATYHMVEGSTGTFFGYVNLPASLAAPVASAPQAAKAWRHVVQALVTTAPADLRKAQAARRHIARIGRRA